ncbi:MAG: methyltransferase domain-containing protein [Kiritimatiellae bacterium]|nr:methyltransferase domain-containing protein [Kiritimatiellia bacterium]
MQKPLDQSQCHFVEGDLLNVPFADDSFDVVISLRLVSHMKKGPMTQRNDTRIQTRCDY